MLPLRPCLLAILMAIVMVGTSHAFLLPRPMKRLGLHPKQRPRGATQVLWADVSSNNITDAVPVLPKYRSLHSAETRVVVAAVQEINPNIALWRMRLSTKEDALA